MGERNIKREREHTSSHGYAEPASVLNEAGEARGTFLMEKHGAFHSLTLPSHRVSLSRKKFFLYCRILIANHMCRYKRNQHGPFPPQKTLVMLPNLFFPYFSFR